VQSVVKSPSTTVSPAIGKQRSTVRRLGNTPNGEQSRVIPSEQRHHVCDLQPKGARECIDSPAVRTSDVATLYGIDCLAGHATALREFTLCER
jgi:hypothetical protein